jgi:hypothetical protein
MRFSIRAAAFAAIGVGAVNLAAAQGPIREGVRRTGEAAANVTRGVVEGTANAARGVAQGTANVARGVGEVAAGTVRGTGRVVGNALGITPNTPIQARAGANLAAVDQSREARWRFARHNGEWWYYTPQNEWMYHRGNDWQRFSQDSFQPMNQGQQFNEGQQFAQDQPLDQSQQYSSGYRGVDQGQPMPDQGQAIQTQGAQQQVRYDRQGRAFICENGRPLYLDEGQFQGEGQYDQAQMSPTPATPQEHSVARQDLDQQAAPQQPAEQSTLQSNQATQSSAAPATPQPSASTSASGSADVSSAPAGSASSSQVQPGVAAPREINNNPASQTQGAAVNPEQ